MPELVIYAFSIYYKKYNRYNKTKMYYSSYYYCLCYQLTLVNKDLYTVLATSNYK